MRSEVDPYGVPVFAATLSQGVFRFPEVVTARKPEHLAYAAYHLPAERSQGAFAAFPATGSLTFNGNK